jgi:hypothetical protein
LVFKKRNPLVPLLLVAPSWVDFGFGFARGVDMTASLNKSADHAAPLSMLSRNMLEDSESEKKKGIICYDIMGWKGILKEKTD